MFVVVGAAALFVTGALFAFALALVALKFKLTRGEEVVAGAIMLVLPVGLAGRWIFRKLQAHNPHQEARAAAIAFVVVAPVAGMMAFLLGDISGGYSGVLFGTAWAFLGAVVGTAVMFSILSFMGVVFKLWTMRREAANGGSPPP